MPPADDPSSTSLWALFSAKHLGASLMLAGGIALYAIETYVTATIMPSVVRDIGGLPLFAWVTTLYVTAPCSVRSSSPSAKGPQPQSHYSVGAALFLLGSAICAAAPHHGNTFLPGALCRGSGPGPWQPLGYAFIRYVYPEHLWSKATTLYAAIWGIRPSLANARRIFCRWERLAPRVCGHRPFRAADEPSGTEAVAERRGREDRDQGATLADDPAVCSLLLVSFASTAEKVDLRIWLVIGALFAIAALVWVERRATLRILPRARNGAVNADRPRLWRHVHAAGGADLRHLHSVFLQNLHAVPPLISGYIVALVALGWTASAFLCSDLKGKAMRRSILAGRHSGICLHWPAGGDLARPNSKGMRWC